MNSTMIDLQSSPVNSQFHIQEAGVFGVDYPFIFRDLNNSQEQTVHAKWTLGAYIEKHQRGTHMSRFMIALEKLRKKSVNFSDLCDWSFELQKELQTSQITITSDFTWFHEIEAPISKQLGLLDHKISFKAKSFENQNLDFSIGIEVSAKSLCPCSKAISDRGAHNQRSQIYAEIKPRSQKSIPSLAEISELLRNCASSPVYPILKRDDEKHVTEFAYDHPAFVEDIARNVVQRLSIRKDLKHISCMVRNIESIHSHDCYAKISVEL